VAQIRPDDPNVVTLALMGWNMGDVLWMLEDGGLLGALGWV